MSLQALLQSLPQIGRVVWIGVRPQRTAALLPVDEVEALADTGLRGDHYSAHGGARQVSLIQAEHLAAVASMLGRTECIDPAVLRRQIAVAGINLLALKDKRFRVGSALFEYSGVCHPCSRMETLLGAGGYNAMRGHGGITARIVQSGSLRLGDAVLPTPALADPDPIS